MKQTDTISSWQIILICMTAIGLHNHVIVITPLIQTAGRDAWMSVIATSALAFVWGFILLFIHRGTKQEHLYTWLKSHVGKPVAVLIGGLVYLYFILLATITLKETMTWTKITYLQNTPLIILTIFFVILCLIAAFTSLRTIAIANFFILAFVVLLGFFVAFANIPVKNYSLLLPMLEHGYSPIIKGMVFPGSGFAELVLLLFLQHKFQSKVRYSRIALTIIIITFLTVGPLIGGIVEFGPQEAGKQRFTAFEEWGLVSFGRYIEHLDFLSIYQWLAGAFIRISMMFLITLEIFQLKKTTGKVVTLTMLASLTIFLTVYPFSDITYYNILKHLLIPISFWFCFIISFLLAGIVLIIKIKEKKEQI
ncbi:GerAB/ArcD/ProY family transporter [Lederbergia lenta]|uniref:GerAB/ArcD/ProY family transporter n=1 Tax=Lederbergia lenta TaxID=1467 RepID=UPI002041C2CC|nr:endospore germination permease [Lederbergia lenta]MCM3112514.1 endospore germination permease [Lederbergia lenta]